MKKLFWSGDVGPQINQESVKMSMDGVGHDDLEVELTTMGGDFFQAAPIMNNIKNMPNKKVVRYNGIVASAGSVIAMGFDKRIARSNSMFMIHNAQGVVFGDQNEMSKMAKAVEGMSDTIAREYVRVTKKPIEEIKSMMDAETWLFGQEIVDAGFADELEQVEEVINKGSAIALAKLQMKMKAVITNAAGQKMTLSSVNFAKELISAGKINATDRWQPTATDENKLLGESGDDWDTYAKWHMVEDENEAEGTKNRFKYLFGINGVVYRSALRAIASRAAQQNLQDVSDMASSLLDLMDKTKNKGNRMNKEEVLAYLKDNPGIPLEEIAGVMNQSDKLDNGRIKSLTEENDRLKAENLAVESDKIENSLDKEFGASGDKNLLRAYAGKQVWNSAKFDEQLAEFKKDPIALNFAGQQVNANSAINIIEKNQNQVTAKTICGVPVVEV